jgi:hypothetical protein
MRQIRLTLIRAEPWTRHFARGIHLLFFGLFIASCGGGNDDSMRPSPILGSNATLASLSINGADLDPAFDSSVTDYTAAVGFAAKSTQVTATAEDVSANVSVNGTAVNSGVASDSIPLDVGTNTITVNVTAEDGTTTQTYTVVVVRQKAPAFAQTAYVKASDTGVFDEFGKSVALSADGSTMAVGADDGISDLLFEAIDAKSKVGVSLTGDVHVFTRDSGGTWAQQAYITASNPDYPDFFGSSVALSADGTTLAVGAWGESSATTGVNGDETDNSAWQSGAAYVFTRDSGGTWIQQAYIKASNIDKGDEFGRSVTLSADGATLAVGATGESSGRDSGAAYVFTRDSGGTWTQQAYIKASNTDKGDRFGSSVALSADGTTLAVGAWGESSAAIGVNGDGTDNTAPRSGAAYVFIRDSEGVWTQQAYIKASNTDSVDFFGQSVALSANGATLAVSASFEDSAAIGVNGDETDNTAPESGAAYLFTRDSGGTWTQQAYIKASNTDSGDWFGQSVALSADGATLAVSATFEDSAAIGVNGDETDNSARASGAAYVFTRDSDGVWTQQAYVKASNTDQGDRFGWSVALSANGATLAVGATGESSAVTGVNGDETDNTVSESGAAYVFEL